LAKLIQDLWILTENGITLYHRAFDPKINEQLFGGLMSALNSFAENLVEGGLSSFEMSNKRFNLMRKHNLFFIANSSKKNKEKKVIPELEKVAEIFTGLYPDDFFNTWDNDISIFQNFEGEISDKLQDPIKKFWNRF